MNDTTSATKWLILGTVTLGSFVGVMEANIIGVAMPQMQGRSPSPSIP